MSKNKLLILFLMSLLMSALFVFSAFAKVYPSISPFEKQLVDLGIADWSSVPYFSRLIIGFELFLGLAFLQSSYIKRIIIPSTVLLLIVFCVHLSITIYNEGANSGNCGCFGQLIPMTPLQALIKNIVTLGLLGYMYVLYREKEKNFYSSLVIVFLLSLLIVFVYRPVKEYQTISSNPVFVQVDSTVKDSVQVLQAVDSVMIKERMKFVEDSLKKVKSGKKVPLDTTKKIVVNPGPKPVQSIFNSFTSYSNGLKSNPDQGKKIVALFSLECEHCMATAKEIGNLKRKRNMPETLVLFWGTEDQVPNFFKQCDCTLPYQIVDPVVFFPLLGKAPSPPRVVYMHNGNIQGDWDNSTFKIADLEKAIDKN